MNFRKFRPNSPFITTLLIAAVLLLILGAGALILPPVPPLISLSPTGPSPTTTLPLTPTSTPTPTPTATLTNTPTLIVTTVVPATETPSPTTPVKTETLTPSPTPTPIICNVLGNLNLRSGPGISYPLVKTLYPGDRLIISGFTIIQSVTWLKAKNLNSSQEGWASARYIDNLCRSKPIPTVDPTLIPTPPPPSPPPPDTGTPSQPPVPPPSRPIIAVGGPSVSGSIGPIDEAEPNDEAEHIFIGSQERIVVLLMFTPNYGSISFQIYPQNEPNNIVGRGSRPPSDLDGVLDTGELIWASSSLVVDTHYVVRITNGSSEEIQYCLATIYIESWSC